MHAGIGTRAAAHIGFASLEQGFQRRLPISGETNRQGHIGWRHAIEYGASHGAGELTLVLQGRTRTVGGANQVPLCVAQVGTHGLDILHRQRGGVLAQVAVGQTLQAGHAGTQTRQLMLAVHGVLQGQRFFVGALQRGRLAGSALVNEHQVALVVQACQSGQQHGRDADGALAGPASQQQDRIGALVARHGRYHQVVDIDLHTVSARGVQRAANGAALHFVRNAVHAARLARASCDPGYCATQRKRCACAKNQVPSGPLHAKSSPPKKKHRRCRCLAELHLRWMQNCACCLPSPRPSLPSGPCGCRLPVSGRTVRSFGAAHIGINPSLTSGRPP